MPPKADKKSRKADKDGGTKKKLKTDKRDSPVPMSKGRAIRSMEKDSLATAATPATTTPGTNKSDKPKSMSKSQAPETLNGTLDKDETSKTPSGNETNNSAMDPATVSDGQSETEKSIKTEKSISQGLKIDVSQAKNVDEKVKSPRPSGTAMDTHPYARGSVIEVLHGVEEQSSDDDWWSDDSDEESMENKGNTSIRLCDIIDRVAVGENKFRYYVHYKDFNRRMDEWISMDRIVSPPSIGNAKARAIKKEEEKQKREEKRKQQKLEEKKAEEAIDVSAPRASRRRASTITQPPGTEGSGVPADGESDTPRRTRHSRRKSVDDDTVVASNQNESPGKEDDAPPPSVVATELVAIPTQSTMQTTVGEHVVQTIQAQELDEHEGLDEASLREHEEVTKVKNVAFLELGAHQMETWYYSPLPKELLSERGLIEVLYVCEFTFSMFARKTELQRFQARLPSHARHPPGNEIYRNGNLSMFEVDGLEERIYCQNLCYIAKLFLDHKTLYFDVDPFLFYVLCEVDERGFHPVGYYSKEKYSDVGYNLACILTFPSHQRKGYGRFLIAFSYALTKKEEKVGSPEKPMSDLGQQAYKPYWASTIVDFLLNNDSSSMSIMDISKMTAIMAEDIVFTLNQLGVLKIINGVYFIAAEEGLLRKLAKKYPVKEPRVDPSKLHWTPFLTDVKRDKFSIHSKKPNLESEERRGSGGFP